MAQTISAYCDDSTVARVASTGREVNAAFQATLKLRKAAFVEGPYPQPLRDVFAAHGRPIHMLSVLDKSLWGIEANFTDARMTSPIMRVINASKQSGILLHIQSRQNHQIIGNLVILQYHGAHTRNTRWTAHLNEVVRKHFSQAHLAEKNAPAMTHRCEDCPFLGIGQVNFRTVIGPLLAGTHPVARLTD